MPFVAEIIPQYGWGWRYGTNSYNVPDNFMVEITQTAGDGPLFSQAVGRVVKTENLELLNKNILLTSRTSGEGGGTYNVLLRTTPFNLDAFTEEPNTITGFAQIEIQKGSE
jgi:hypothetical protein